MKNYKTIVTPKQSEKIQKLCFDLGIFWETRGVNVSYIDYPYLFINDGVIYYADSDFKATFKEDPIKEIKAEKLIKKLKKKVKKLPLQDKIKNPKHYKMCDIEAIDIIQKGLTPEAFSGYLLGNILKYLLRAGKKNDALEDINKALEYENIWNKINKGVLK